MFKDRCSFGLEWALHNLPKPHTFTSLPLQSTGIGSGKGEGKKKDGYDETGIFKIPALPTKSDKGKRKMTDEEMDEIQIKEKESIQA
jgi:hypothetical protein